MSFKRFVITLNLGFQVEKYLANLRTYRVRLLPSAKRYTNSGIGLRILADLQSSSLAQMFSGRLRQLLSAMLFQRFKKPSVFSVTISSRCSVTIYFQFLRLFGVLFTTIFTRLFKVSQIGSQTIKK